MKNTVEITLRSIHIGSSREVTTLAIDGKDPADKFLKNLKKKDPIAFKAKQLPNTKLIYEEPES